MRSPLARAIVLIVIVLSFNWKTLGDWAEEVRLFGSSEAEIQDAFLESRTIYGFRPTRPWKTERRYRDLRRVIEALEVHTDDGRVMLVTNEGLTQSERSFVRYRSQYYLYPRAVVVVGEPLEAVIAGSAAVAFLEAKPTARFVGVGSSPVPDHSVVAPLSGSGQ